MKDYEQIGNCNNTYCEYFNENMELNCSYSEDNSKCIKALEPLSSHVVLGDVAISQVDFVHLMTQLDAIEILLREDNFKMYCRASLEKMIKSLKIEFEKYVGNIA